MRRQSTSRHVTLRISNALLVSVWRRWTFCFSQYTSSSVQPFGVLFVVTLRSNKFVIALLWYVTTSFLRQSSSRAVPRAVGLSSPPLRFRICIALLRIFKRLVRLITRSIFFYRCPLYFLQLPSPCLGQTRVRALLSYTRWFPLSSSASLPHPDNISAVR